MRGRAWRAPRCAFAMALAHAGGSEMPRVIATASRTAAVARPPLHVDGIERELLHQHARATRTSKRRAGACYQRISSGRPVAYTYNPPILEHPLCVRTCIVILAPGGDGRRRRTARRTLPDENHAPRRSRGRRSESGRATQRIPSTQRREEGERFMHAHRRCNGSHQILRRLAIVCGYDEQQSEGRCEQRAAGLRLRVQQRRRLTQVLASGLSQGYRVVAVEANPSLAKHAQHHTAKQHIVLHTV